MLHLEHHRYRHDYQRDTDDVLGYDKYLAEPHLAAHADGSLHHIYRIETGNHDGRKDSRKDGDDDVSQRQEPQKVEGMEQVDFRIQHRIEQRNECPGNQQAQQEADCREERRLLEIAQHHAPYRFAQQSSGSHLLRTVANLSHRKIDVVEQGRKQQNQRHDQEDIHESTIAMLENIDIIIRKMNLVPSYKLATPHKADSIRILLPSLPVVYVFAEQGLSHFFRVSILCQSRHRSAGAKLIHRLSLSFYQFHRHENIIWVKKVLTVEILHDSHHLELQLTALDGTADRIGVAEGFLGKRFRNHCLMSIRKEMIRRTTTAFVTHKLGEVRVDSQIFCLIILSIYHGSLRSIIFTKSCPSLDFRDGRKELLGCAPGHSEIIA